MSSSVICRRTHLTTYPGRIIAPIALLILGLLPAKSVMAQSQIIQVTATCAASDTTPFQNDIISVDFVLHPRDLPAPNNRIAAYQASLDWDPKVLQFRSPTLAPAPWNHPNIDSSRIGAGHFEWNDFNAGGVDPADFAILKLSFRVIGAPGSRTKLDLEFSELVSSNFVDLRNVLGVEDATIHVQAAVEELTCQIDIISPADGAAVCADSIEVTAVATFGGGFPPLTVAVNVNGRPAAPSGTTFKVTLPPASVGVNLLVATCIVTDNQGIQATDTDSVRVHRASPPTSSVRIVSPLDGVAICGDSVTVVAETKMSGGERPFSLVCSVNGFAAHRSGATFMATVPLVVGPNTLIAVCTLIDSCANEVVSLDTAHVVRAAPLLVNVEITSPQDGSTFCGDTLLVTGRHSLNGGASPFSVTCTVNGVAAAVVGDEFSARIHLPPAAELVVAICTATDSCGNEVAAADTVRLKRPPRLVSHVRITSPVDGTFHCADSIAVQGVHSVSGGVPPFTMVCSINGVAATVHDSTFSAVVKLGPGVEVIVAHCTVTDNCGQRASADDTVRIVRGSSPVCNLQITSPVDGAIVCEDTILVGGTATITNGRTPFTLKGGINGIAATAVGTQFSARVPVVSGTNLIIASFTLTDSCGNQALCVDSVQVFRDDLPPSCTFTDHGTFASGTIIDNESGIASIVALKLKNATLTIDPAFSPGAHSVNFRIDAIDTNKPKGFSIDITDVCGNTFNCDPILLSLSTDLPQREVDFTFPATDRYLELANHGLSEIRISINGRRFALFADASRAHQEFNAFGMPLDGYLIIDLQPYLHADENDMRVAFDGPLGSFADVALMDIAHHVDYVLELTPLPEEFELSQNFPNPFNPTTNIRFAVPAGETDGLVVQLRIFNLRGELVREFNNERKLPGVYVMPWDGRNDRSEPVASGVYIYQLKAGNYQQAKRMLLLK